MVAGRRLWGCNEQHSAQHQAGRGGNLGIEGVIKDGLGAGEARRLRTYVEASWEIDKEDHGKADQPEREDDPTQAAPPVVAQHGKGEDGGEHGDGDQEEGMRFAGTLGADGGSARRRQAGVARLADLDGTVIDELSRDQADGRTDDGQADRPLRRQHGTDPGRGPPSQGGAA
jgi:hypothetical protein